ncbi:MAG TPA: hypothetical protein VMU59_14790 [Caulobacteraceae bacterium]|nr:hypothetical protein [Caulobacteraceae bacterium]
MATKTNFGRRAALGPMLAAVATVSMTGPAGAQPTGGDFPQTSPADSARFIAAADVAARIKAVCGAKRSADGALSPVLLQSGAYSLQIACPARLAGQAGQSQTRQLWLPIRGEATVRVISAKGGAPQDVVLSAGDAALIPAGPSYAFVPGKGAPVFLALGPLVPSPAETGSAPLVVKDIPGTTARLAASVAAQSKAKDLIHLMQAPSPPLNLEYHAAVVPGVRTHTKEGEIFFVLQGAGAMDVGGRLVNPHRDGDDLVAASSTGGTLMELKAGDIIVMAPNTAYPITRVDGKLVLLSLHLPRASVTTP